MIRRRESSCDGDWGERLGAEGQPNWIRGVIAAATGVAVGWGLPCSADYVYHVPYFLADGDERRHSVLRVGCTRCCFFFDFEITGIDDAGNVFGPVHVGDPEDGLRLAGNVEDYYNFTSADIERGNAEEGYPMAWGTARATGGS